MKFNEVFGNAKWVTCEEGCISPYIRAEFEAPCKSAEITLCGFGYANLYINGRRVGDEFFLPLNSCYHYNPNLLCVKNDGEELGSRTYPVKYDISDYLVDGKNALCVHLGPGWYAHGDMQKQEDEWIKPYGVVKAAWRVVFGDGSELVSDESAVWAQSPLLSCNLYCCEIQDDAYYIPDASEPECAFTGWKPVKLTDVPDTDYYFSDCPPDRIIRNIIPKEISRRDGHITYDVGENITGRVVFTTDGPCGVGIRHSENVTPEGEIDPKYHHWQWMKYECRGVREYSEMFKWSGFRYFEISDCAKVLRVEEIHTDVAVTAAFECNDDMLNWYHDAFVRTQLNNMHGGIPSDCPHMERRGYTGDGELTCEAVMNILDCENFYRKWMKDISDCQDRKSGHVQHTAPYIPSGGGPGGWGCAIIEVPYQFWRQYGDISPLAEMYPQAKKYFEYLDSVSTDGIMYVNPEDRMSWLGEWAVPIGWTERMNVLLPPPYVTAYFYVRSLNRAIEAAKALGKDEDIPAFEAKKRYMLDVIVKNYYDEATGDFAENTLFGNCYAVDLGLGDKRTWDNLVAAVEEKKCLYTGIFGTDITLRLLFERGREDLAYMLMTSEKENSFGWWRNHGMTTLCEHWDMDRSLDHPMFGSSDRYLFRYILGIRQPEGSRGWEKLVVKPVDIPQVCKASGHIDTPKGLVSVSFEKTENNAAFIVETDLEGEFEFRGMSMPLKRGRNIIIQ
ncbi:MAG: family 78 glycoside hydrolase catalytic domain [Clostridia bacterium]|nr:family 78 glycoside hydrolase catalytic domain [Clostridia bacterium]